MTAAAQCWTSPKEEEVEEEEVEVEVLGAELQVEWAACFKEECQS